MLHNKTLSDLSFFKVHYVYADSEVQNHQDLPTVTQTKNYAGRDFNYMDTKYLIFFYLRKDPINTLVVVLGFYKVNKEKSTRLNLIQKAGRCALGVWTTSCQCGGYAQEWAGTPVYVQVCMNFSLVHCGTGSLKPELNELAPRILSAFQALELHVDHQLPRVFMGSKAPNSNPHSELQSALSTKPSLQHPKCQF